MLIGAVLIGAVLIGSSQLIYGRLAVDMLNQVGQVRKYCACSSARWARATSRAALTSEATA